MATTWLPGYSLKGAPGAQLRYGSGPPSSSNPSVQSDGDSYVDITTGFLYAVRSGGVWPTTYASLACKDGATISVGTGAPSTSNPSTQKDGDLFVQTDAAAGPTLWGPRANGSWPATSYSLAGKAGSNGSNGNTITQGTSIPGSGYGNTGDIYIQLPNILYYKNASGWSAVGIIANTTTYGTSIPGINYGQGGDTYFQNSNGVVYLWSKATGQWQNVAQLTGQTGAAGTNGTNGLSVLIGSGAPASSLGVANQAYIDTTNSVLYAKSSTGWNTGVSFVGATGPQSPGLRSGSGAPTSTNPSYQVDGDYFLRTDVSPFQLYGPRASGVWPSTSYSTSGGYFQTSNGPPAANLGNVGDVCVDVVNAFWWPPKLQAGWVTPPINMVGPSGPPGTATSRTIAVKGFVWGTNSTANAALNVCQPLDTTAGTATYSVLPVTEVMPFSGILTAVTAYCPGGVSASTASVNVLRNGTNLYTASNIITCSASAVATYGRAAPNTTMAFAAGDVLTMTSNISATGGMCIYYTLYYTLTG